MVSKAKFVESLKKSLNVMFPRMELEDEHEVSLSSLSPIMWDYHRKEG